MVLSRAWYARVGCALRAHGFSPSRVDISLFLVSIPKVTIYLLVYVDDITLVSSSLSCAHCHMGRQNRRDEPKQALKPNSLYSGRVDQIGRRPAST
jgi:hypothetical protein